jgi:hypothetical protein
MPRYRESDWSAVEELRRLQAVEDLKRRDAIAYKSMSPQQRREYLEQSIQHERDLDRARLDGQPPAPLTPSIWLQQQRVSDLDGQEWAEDGRFLDMVQEADRQGVLEDFVAERGAAVAKLREELAAIGGDFRRRDEIRRLEQQIKAGEAEVEHLAQAGDVEVYNAWQADREQRAADIPRRMREEFIGAEHYPPIQEGDSE